MGIAFSALSPIPSGVRGTIGSAIGDGTTAMHKLVSTLAAALITAVVTTFAQTSDTVDFNQEFSDLQAVSTFDPDISAALFRAALTRINATYVEWSPPAVSEQNALKADRR